MSYGFVYVLASEYMPDLIKIGCTERSPFARAEELSRPTGVPTPFQVLCYAEFQDFQAVERKLHDWLSTFRVNSAREFFHGCQGLAVAYLWFHPGRLSFTDATAIARAPHDSELVMRVCRAEKHERYLDDLRNPFSSTADNDAREATRASVAAQIEAVVLDEEPVQPLRLVGGGE